jgi:hypothetical protein
VNLAVWKFAIPNDKWTPDPVEKGLSWKGCCAVVVAANETAARKHLERVAKENGFDARWLRAAQVIPIPIEASAFVCWYQE